MGLDEEQSDSPSTRVGALLRAGGQKPASAAANLETTEKANAPAARMKESGRLLRELYGCRGYRRCGTNLSMSRPGIPNTEARGCKLDARLQRRVWRDVFVHRRKHTCSAVALQVLR